MIRRTRRVAGLLTLLALTFSLAESAWAATCAVSMPAGTRAEAIPEGPAGMQEASHDPDRDCTRAPDEEPCPFSSPVAAQVCLGIASLPATEEPLPAAVSRGVTQVFVLPPRSDLLLESSVFRPPRA